MFKIGFLGTISLTALAAVGIPLAASAAKASATAPQAAVQSLGDMLKNGNILEIFGRLVVGLITGNISFNNEQEATNEKTCQPRENAKRLVNGQVYQEDAVEATGADGDYVCQGVKLNGFNDSDSEHISGQMSEVLSNPGQQTGEFVFTDNKGRERRYEYAASETVKRQVELPVTMIDGIFVPDQNSVFDVQDKLFYAIDVRTRLNLRSGPGTNFDITGKFLGNDIVEIIGFVSARDDRRKCKSGRWALLASSGAGVGYICADYLKDAPLGASRKDVALARRPDTKFRPKSYSRGAKRQEAKPRQQSSPRSSSSGSKQTFQRTKVKAVVPCKSFSAARITKKGKRKKAKTNTSCIAGGGQVGFNF